MKQMRLLCSIFSAVLSVSSSLSTSAQAPTLNLAQPGTEYSSALLGTSPSLAVFNGAIYLAFKGNYSDNSLWLTYSTATGAFTNPGKNFKNIVMLPGTAPAITTWNGKLWLAYTNNADSYVYLTSTSDGVTFATPSLAHYCTGCQAYTSTSQPSLAVYNNQLWLAWDSATGVQYATYNGSAWVYNQGCSSPDAVPLAATTIGLATFGSDLYFTYGANKASNYELVVCKTNGLPVGSANGFATTNTYPSLQVGGGISMYTDAGYMYLAYKDISTSDYIHVTGSTDGLTFTSTTYTGIKENGDSSTAGGTTVFNSKYYFAYVENSSSHHLWVSTAPYPY